jgi:asparagine synthase (glutamine-hydrolysing)
MSAIFGVFYPDGKPVTRVELDAMSESLSHRGTDDATSWSDGPIGLGHRMRWTTPESRGERLPKSYREGRFVISADARIDNSNELLDQLGSGHLADHESITDTDIIVSSYEKWGERCIEKFLGDSYS